MLKRKCIPPTARGNLRRLKPKTASTLRYKKAKSAFRKSECMPTALNYLCAGLTIFAISGIEFRRNEYCTLFLKDFDADKDNYVQGAVTLVFYSLETREAGGEANEALAARAQVHSRELSLRSPVLQCSDKQTVQ